ncbi:MAG: NusG domain II-containing protein [Firmicutes bacterium]|nr:NusG domain II-containing protein [Bacillota bacterium]
MNIPKITFIKINKKEILIVIGLLILALTSYLFINNQNPGAKVKIEVNQRLYGTYDLNKTQEILVRDNGGNILLRSLIINGKIHVISSTCKDKICVHQGEISLSGQTIVCLPNKVVITIINDADKIDGVLK